MPTPATLAEPAPMPESEAHRLSRERFDALYTALGPRLLRFLTGQVRDPDLASDLLQETFLRLLRSPVRAFSNEELNGYVFRTAHSVMMDHFRRRQRDRRWSLFTRPNAAASAEPTGELDRVFAKLKPRERSLLWMAYVEEMSHDEIAAALGVKAHSVKVLLHRARKRLGDMLNRDRKAEISR